MKRLFLILAFLLFSASANAATHYVDLNLPGGTPCTSGNYSIASRNCTGSDGNAYVSMHAMASNLAPGDIVNVRAGTYSVGINCQTTTCDTGTVGAGVITWQTYLSEVVTINDQVQLFNSNLQYWTFNDFIFDLNAASGKNCFQMTGNTYELSPDFITINGGQCRDTHLDGMLIRGQGHHINGVTFTNCGDPTVQPATHPIYVTAKSRDIIIENSTFDDPGTYGIHIWDNTNAGNANGIIRYNTIKNVADNPNFGQGGIVLGAHGWHAYSNLIYNIVSDGNSEGIAIRYIVNGLNANRADNNTILMGAVGTGIRAGTTATNSIIQNNIVMGGNFRIDNLGTGTICSTNLTSDTSAIGCATAVDTAANTWTNSAADDFTLKQGSKAIGTGVDLSGTIQNLDINGATRTVPWDLGAIKAPITALLTLHTPDGGESWQIGSMQTVTWTSIGNSGNVNITEDRDGNGSYEFAVAGPITDDGSHIITIGGSAGSSRKMQVCDADGSPCDVSNTTYAVTVAAGGTITLLISNNTSGTYQGNIGGVISALLGESTPDFNFGIASGIRANKFGAGSHSHSVLKFPTNSIPSNAIVIAAEIGLYLTAFTAAGTPSIDFRNNKRSFVQNEATWTIYSTGNNWGTPGGLNATDRDSAVVCNMPISATTFQYYTCSGAALITWAQGLVNLSTPNNGLHLERFGTGNDGLVRTFGAENPMAAYLSITYTTSAPTITLTSPISGAHFFPGKVVPIHWQSQGISGNVRILMSPNAGISYTEIEDSHPFGQVDFVWPVPPMQSSSSVVFKVESVNTPAVFGLSNPIRIGGRRTGLKQ